MCLVRGWLYPHESCALERPSAGGWNILRMQARCLKTLPRFLAVGIDTSIVCTIALKTVKTGGGGHAKRASTAAKGDLLIPPTDTGGSIGLGEKCQRIGQQRAWVPSQAANSNSTPHGERRAGARERRSRIPRRIKYHRYGKANASCPSALLPLSPPRVGGAMGAGWAGTPSLVIQAGMVISLPRPRPAMFARWWSLLAAKRAPLYHDMLAAPPLLFTGPEGSCRVLFYLFPSLSVRNRVLRAVSPRLLGLVRPWGAKRPD